MTLVKTRTVFGGKPEAVPGVAESILAADCGHLVYDLEIQPDFTVTERAATGQSGTQSSVPGGRKGTATFKIDLAATGAAVPAFADLLFPACGLVKTGNVFKPRTQSPDTPSAAVKTITLAKFTDGKRRLLFGAMGTFRMIFPTEDIVTFEFEFNGVWGGETDAAVPAPTYPTAPKLRSSGGLATWAGTNICMESMTLDLANTIYVKPCSNIVQGYEFALATNRKPKVTGNPESQLVAQQNRMGQFEAGTEGILRYVVPCSGYDPVTHARSVEFRSNQAQIIANSETSREGIASDDITWQLNQNPALLDDDFSIIFNLAT